MDLPTCPACKQSVLDDDAVDCPFCGAPMKGGPAQGSPGKPRTATAPKAAPSKAATTKTTPGTTSTTSVSAVKMALGADKPAKTAKTTEKETEKELPPAEDDDPFAVDQSVAADAVPVSRQQGPGKTLEVKCPMCETKGFIAPKAAGKLVKCCNPECLVPIFTAPAIEKKQPVAAPPKPKIKLPWLYVVGGIVVAGIAAACIWVMNQEGTREIPPIDLKNVIGGNPDAKQKPDGAEEGPIAEHKTKEVASGEDPATIARKRLIADALDRLKEVSLHAESNRKALCWRLAATAYLYAGDFKQAASQLDLLEKSRNSQDQAVLPVTLLAWQKATAAPEEFSRNVDRAQRLGEKLPSRGRYATEAAIATAALLAGSGKADAARTLLDKHHADPAIDQLAAAIRIIADDETFDLDITLPGRTIGDWQAPLETAVTLILANHGRWDDALAWATGAADAVARAEGATVWAESFARRAVPDGDAGGFERAKKAADGHSDDGKARLLARLAAVKVSTGDAPGAEELIAEAQTALDTILRPPAIKLQGAKSVLDLPLPKAIPLRQAALAAAEIAGVQAQLAHRDAAWNNILLSLKFLHAIAPSTSAVLERAQQLDRSPETIKVELKKVLAIKKDDEARLALSRYKEKLGDIKKSSQLLFYWEEVILTAAAEFGLVDQVWEELQALNRKPIPEREPLLSTAVPLYIAARYSAAGNAKKAAEITEAVESRSNAADPLVVRLVSEQMFNAGDYSGCAQRLNDAMTATGTLQEWALRLACRLVSAGKYSEAIEFCGGFKIQALKDDGLFLIAALAARQGHAGEFWEAAAGLSRMEAAAVCSGLVVGLEAQSAAK